MRARNKESKETFEVVEQDEDGKVQFDGKEFDVAKGTFVLKDKRGNKRLCHPTAFANEYETIS